MPILLSQMLFVATGGAVGSALRFLLSRFFPLGEGQFPWSTFTVNALGCFAAGICLIFLEKGRLSEDARLFLITGVLGGFTTFSAFGMETVSLLRRDQSSLALIYVVLSVLCGIGGVCLGRYTLRP